MYSIHLIVLCFCVLEFVGIKNLGVFIFILLVIFKNCIKESEVINKASNANKASF